MHGTPAKVLSPCRLKYTSLTTNDSEPMHQAYLETSHPPNSFRATVVQGWTPLPKPPNSQRLPWDEI